MAAAWQRQRGSAQQQRWQRHGGISGNGGMAEWHGE